jgi:hypothetical protein
MRSGTTEMGLAFEDWRRCNTMAENAFLFSKQRCWHSELSSGWLTGEVDEGIESRSGEGEARRINKLATLYKYVQTAGDRKLSKTPDRSWSGQKLIEGMGIRIAETNEMCWLVVNRVKNKLPSKIRYESRYLDMKVKCVR